MSSGCLHLRGSLFPTLNSAGLSSSMNTDQCQSGSTANNIPPDAQCLPFPQRTQSRPTCSGQSDELVRREKPWAPRRKRRSCEILGSWKICDEIFLRRLLHFLQTNIRPLPAQKTPNLRPTLELHDEHWARPALVSIMWMRPYNANLDRSVRAKGPPIVR